jgi:uncharacterized membrane protein YccC
MTLLMRSQSAAAGALDLGLGGPAERRSFDWSRSQGPIFGLKVFGAAMTALYIGLALGLERPFWAMLTAFIVAQPLTGMALSKGAYRIAGTLAGASWAVFNLMAFAGAPELQALGFAAWLGLCVYLASIDRTARAYAFALAGYTACLIGLPSVDTPISIFDVALARVEEITLGTLCMTLIDAVVLPQPAGPVLLQRLDAWLGNTGRWARDVLAGTVDRATARVDMRRLIASAAALDELRGHASYDTPALRRADRGLRLIQRRSQMVLSVLVAIGHRLATFRDRRPEISQELTPLLGRIAAWMDHGAGGASEPDQHTGLRAAIAARVPDDEAIRGDSDRLLFRTLVHRLDDLVKVWAGLGELRHGLMAGRQPAGTVEPLSRHRDHLLAGVTAISAFLTVLVCSAIWIATAWPQGATATMMAGTICALLGIRDEPVQPAQQFLVMSVAGSVLAMIYLFAVLPRVDGFVPLTLVLAPVFLPLAMCLQQPARAARAMPLIMGSLALMALDQTFDADIAGFVNGAIALNLGVAIAVIVLRLGRSLGIEWEVERVMRAVRRDVARLAAGDAALDRAAFESRMHDRVALLFPRLAGADQALAGRLGDALVALRVGINILLLRRTTPGLPGDAQRALAELNESIIGSADDRHRLGHNLARTLELADGAMATLAAAPVTPASTDALLALAGIRHALSWHGLLAQPLPETPAT